MSAILRARSLSSTARSRAPWEYLSALAFVALAAIVVAGHPRHPDFEVTPFGGPLPRFAEPSAYHVTYRVTPTDREAYTEDVFVRRPFESYETERDERGPYLTMVIRLGQEVFQARSAPAALIFTPMSPTKRDVRLGAVAQEAIRLHRLRVVGRAVVLGRTCFVVRSASPLNSGPLRPLSGGSYVDTCVDRRGLVLYERTVTGGKTVNERRATKVAVGSVAAEANFDMTGEPTPAERGGGAMRALTLDSRPSSGPFWGISSPPGGFRHTGRYALVPSQPQAYENPDIGSMLSSGLPGSLVASIADTYVRGADAFVIEQGSTVNDAKFSPPEGGIDVDLGPVLGRGQLLLSAVGSEVDAEPHHATRFVRIVGTLPPDELIFIARSMSLAPPGEMRPA